MPFRFPRLLVALATVGGLGAAVLIPADAADAVTRSGDVTAAIPSQIVIDGSPIPITVSSPALTGYFDKVTFALYQGASLKSYDTVAPNKQITVKPFSLTPGAVVGRPALATTYCSIYSSDYCSLDSDFNWYTFVTGLTYTDSAPATAKWGSKIALAGVNDGTHTTWTATAQHYAGYSWQPWSDASVMIGATPVTTDEKGVATWVEQTTALQPLVATATETGDVWSSASTAVTPVLKLAPVTPSPPSKPAPSKPVASKPGHAKASASAAGAASARKKGIPTVRKVVKLTKRNDVNKLLGKSNGYVSAAVLYDTRTACSDGPGVDCGATIEKFTTTAKAKARAKHVQKLLKQYRFLGTEYDTVHGHFLLRVSGDLTRSQAAKYKSAFVKVFK